MHRTQIYLSESQHEALGALTKTRSTTASALIRQAIDGYLASQLSPRERVDALRALASRQGVMLRSSSGGEASVEELRQADGDRLRFRG
jgi:DNA-binding NarL/FixJ family response regulator